jgi:hypothetical protein
MPSSNGVDPKQLSPTAATHFEANLFHEHNPSFFVCQQNSEAMLQYLQDRKLEPVYENFESAYTYLRAEGKLLIPSTATLANMTSSEVENLARANGIPRRDYSGKIIGYDWPKEFQLPPVETADSPTRLSKSQMAHPEDYGRTPTKRELAMWGPDRFDEWVKANGHENRALPPSLTK